MAARKRPKRPAKRADLLSAVRVAADRGDFIETDHARQRAEERDILRPEYVYVLQTGWHERSKDTFNDRYQEWDYAIRGKTVDERELRIVVSFDVETNLLIITVIDLEKRT